MNKLILDLAKEAEILEWEVLLWNKDARTPNHESAAKVAKFAELILKKVLKTCEDHPTWAGRSIGEQIKQDFEVQ